MDTNRRKEKRNRNMEENLRNEKISRHEKGIRNMSRKDEEEIEESIRSLIGKKNLKA